MSVDSLRQLARLIFSGSLPGALSAVAHPVINNKVRSLPRMAATTSNLQDTEQAAPLVLLGRNCFEVFWVNATPIATEVIPFSQRRFSHKESMGAALPGAIREAPVTRRFIEGIEPLPTTISATWINFCPKTHQWGYSEQLLGLARAEISRCLPATIVHAAPAALRRSLLTTYNRACDSLGLHLKLTLSGVKEPDVPSVAASSILAGAK